MLVCSTACHSEFASRLQICDAGFLSWRSHVWTDVDPDRCGILPFVFEDGFGFDRYVEYALDVPVYFVYRDGNYLEATGGTFRDFLHGQLAIVPGQQVLS